MTYKIGHASYCERQIVWKQTTKEKQRENAPTLEILDMDFRRR